MSYVHLPENFMGLSWTKTFLYSFKVAIKLQGPHKKSGSVGLAETQLFFRPNINDTINILPTVSKYLPLNIEAEAKFSPAVCNTFTHPMSITFEHSQTNSL